MAADLVEALPKLRRQPDDGGLQGQMHGGQKLARLVVKFMGNPAALGLGLQELAGEVLQPLPARSALQCRAGHWRGQCGGLGRKEPHQRHSLCIEGPTPTRPQC